MKSVVPRPHTGPHHHNILFYLAGEGEGPCTLQLPIKSTLGVSQTFSVVLHEYMSVHNPIKKQYHIHIHVVCTHTQCNDTHVAVHASTYIYMHTCTRTCIMHKHTHTFSHMHA